LKGFFILKFVNLLNPIYAMENIIIYKYIKNNHLQD